MKASILAVAAAAVAANAASNSSVPYTTSTLLATSVYTITSCAPTVTNCPVGKVTSTVYTSTTYCPVAGYSTSPISLLPPTTRPYPTTVLSTKTYTITSCAPTVTNCPVGKVTSTVITKTKGATTRPPVTVQTSNGVTVVPPPVSTGVTSRPVTVIPPPGNTCPPPSTVTVTVTAPVVPVTPPTTTKGSVTYTTPVVPVTPPTTTQVSVGSAASTGFQVSSTPIQFTGGASSQKAGGLLVALGVAAALL